MASEAERIIKNMSVQVTIEIFAEVIYVLRGVYHIGRDEIGQCLFEFLSEVTTPESEVLKLGIETWH
ncbi:MAG: type II toxin-antitoxin system VapC family toxin [Lachnospiraceae bacterium]|nr:type II toxin-antitoxin system VapC family toxin [Lachnospiraceae bacterium]